MNEVVKNQIREQLNENFKVLPKDTYTLKLKRVMTNRLSTQYDLAIKGGGDVETVTENINRTIENYGDVLEMMKESGLILAEKEGQTSHRVLRIVFRSIFLWVILFSLYFVISVAFKIWTFSWIIFLFGAVGQCYIIFKLFTPKL